MAMDRKAQRAGPAERLENLRRRLDELARQLGNPTGARPQAVPVPVDPRSRRLR